MPIKIKTHDNMFGHHAFIDYGEGSILLSDIDDEQKEKLLNEIRPKGNWIEHEHECGMNWEFSTYECYICHARSEYDSDFCPNCGADMRK